MISKLIISFLIFAAVITGSIAFYSNLSDKYSLIGSTTDLTKLNNTQNIQNKVQTIENTTRKINQGLTPIGIIDSTLVFIFQIGGLLLDTSTMITDVIQHAGDTFTTIPIPIWFIGMLLTITLVYIVFQVISAALRKEM